MNYLQWNDAVIKHFFNEENEEKEVTLYLSRTVINEIGKNNFEETEDDYYSDFLRAIRKGVDGTNNSDYIERIIYLDKHYKKGCRSINGVELNYPPYLAYMLTFILPFTSGEASGVFTMANFHDVAKQYFEENKLTSNYDTHIRSRLRDIDYLWAELSDWLIEENNFSLGYIENIDDINSNRKYVSKYEYHILFRKDQEERLPKVFDDNNILPDDYLSYENMRKLLIDNSSYLKFANNTKDKIVNNDYIGDKIIRRALRFYENWTGSTDIVDNQRASARKKLILCLDFSFLSNRINFKYLRVFSKDPLPENSEVKSSNGTLSLNLSQIQKFYSEPIENCFIDLNSKIDLIDDTNKIKYSWQPKNLLIFKKISQFDWVEISKVEFNAGRTLIICKKEFFSSKLKTWFDEISGNKRSLDNSITKLGNEWTAVWIENIASFPHPNISQLKPDLDEKPKINFNKEIYNNGNIFKDKLPNVWIENIENTSPIAARYIDGEDIELKQETTIEFNEENNEVIVPINLYFFTEKHLKKINQEFKLICNDIETHRYLKIVDFEKVNNEIIDTLLPMRNSIGQITNDSFDNDYVKGLEHYFTDEKIKSIIPYQNLLEIETIGFKNTLEATKYKNKESYNENHLGNILINFISTKGRLSYYDFEQVITYLIESSDEKEEINKIAKDISFRLQDLGFIDYNEEKSSLIVNKPHLVVKPTQSGVTAILTGARDNIFIKEIIRYAESKNIVVDAKYEFSELFPQVLHLKFKDPSHKQLYNFAENFDVIFKKNGLYTQVALPYFFPDLKYWKDYFKHDINSISDFEGGLNFDIETFSFIPKPMDFDKELSLVKFTGISGYKTIYYLWFNNSAYEVNSQPIGIYLFLYLYREQKEKVYKDKRKRDRWSNCGKEIEENETAKEITKILVYDSDKKYLAIPINCSLPLYYSQSISLLSGSKAEVKYLEIKDVSYKGRYLIYKNIPKLFINNVLVSLKQRFHESEIII